MKSLLHVIKSFDVQPLFFFTTGTTSCVLTIIKLIKTNKNGIPDLIAIPPKSNVIFSEVKKPEGKVSKLQEFRMKELKAYGIETEVYRG